jgi:hypothetical protein
LITPLQILTHIQNRLRQALYPDYYREIFKNPDDPSREHHIGLSLSLDFIFANGIPGHCIDQLRQALQCHADLTPMEWTLVGDKIILKTDTVHTCRNFEDVQKWAIERRTNYDEIELLKNRSLYIVD